MCFGRREEPVLLRTSGRDFCTDNQALRNLHHHLGPFLLVAPSLFHLFLLNRPTPIGFAVVPEAPCAFPIIPHSSCACCNIV
jgi:hypothetical protein